MALLNPYLNFAGNTEEAFNFYKSVFGGEFQTLVRFKDTAEASKLPTHEQDKLMHIALAIGPNVLMGTDTLESMGHTLHPGDNISLSFHADSTADADRIYAGLSAGGNATMPMANMFWGDYFGMLTDKFGIQWMINHSNQQQQ